MLIYSLKIQTIETSPPPKLLLGVGGGFKQTKKNMKNNIHRYAKYPYKYYNYLGIIINCNKNSKRLKKLIKEKLKLINI